MSYKSGNPRKIVSLGGTFDVLHKGHKEYIRMGFAYAEYALIYVLSDNYARNLKKYHVRSYDSRVKRLCNFLEKAGITTNQYEIRGINSLSHLERELVNENITVSIVVPEYLDLFHDINQKRLLNKKDSIVVVRKKRTVDPKLGDLSSTAIRFPACIFEYIPQTTVRKITNNQINSPIMR